MREKRIKLHELKKLNQKYQKMLLPQNRRQSIKKVLRKSLKLSHQRQKEIEVQRLLRPKMFREI